MSEELPRQLAVEKQKEIKPKTICYVSRRIRATVFVGDVRIVQTVMRNRLLLFDFDSFYKL
jgi:predicted phosphatase